MTIDELAELISEIENALRTGKLKLIDMCLKCYSTLSEEDAHENEFLVAWLRVTFMHRDKLSHWTKARDNICQILNERDLDGKFILRGLYE